MEIKKKHVQEKTLRNKRINDDNEPFMSNEFVRLSSQRKHVSSSHMKWISPASSDNDDCTSKTSMNQCGSNKLLKYFSSKDIIFSLPKMKPLHNFEHNCLDCSITRFVNDINKRADHEGLKSNIWQDIETSNQTCQLPGNSFKSENEILVKIPKQYAYENDTVLDIALLSELENNSHNMKENSSLALKRAMSELCHRNIDAFNGNEVDNKNEKEANKLCSKITDNISVGLMIELNECFNKKNENTSEGILSEDANNEFRTRQVFHQSNGKTRKPICSSLLIEQQPLGQNIKSSNDEKFKQFYFVNACDKQVVVPPTLNKNCTPQTCGRSNPSINEYYQSCYISNDSPPLFNEEKISILSDNKIESCSFLSKEICPITKKIYNRLPENDKNCPKCSLTSGICSLLPQPQKRHIQPVQNSKQKLPKGMASKHSKKNGSKGNDLPLIKNRSSKSRSSSDKKKAITAKPKLEQNMKSLATKVSSQARAPSCHTKSYTITSLGSFSLFFVIDNMDTGNCDSKMDSASNDLLSTALICVYVKSRLSNMEDNPKRESALSSSCPSIGEVNKFHSSVETDKSAQFSCSCPSLKTDILPSRNSLLSNVMEQSICWCPSAKITRSYEFHEAPADHKKNSTSVGTNTSKAAVLCSSHQKVPCCRPSQIKFSVSVQAERGKSFSTMVCPDRVSATTQCQNTTTENTHKMQPISVQVCASQKSAATQPSVLTPQFPGHESDGKKSSVCIISTRRLQTHAPIVTKKPLSIICPPACAINLPICESRLKVPRICSPLQEYIQKTISTQQSTCCADAQEETFCTNKMRKSCISLKQLISSACCKSEISSSTSPIQSKTCNMCSNLKKPFERQEDRLKTICTFSGECKQEMNAMEIEPPALSPKIFKEKKQLSCSELDIKYSSAVSSKNTTPIASKNSCNICQELAELSACDGSSYKEFKLAASKQKVNMKRPVLANLKGPKTFKQLSHLDVAAAANFIYDEGQKDDLMFITEDYQDLKSAFEKFIVTENVKNPKCKYVRKC